MASHQSAKRSPGDRQCEGIFDVVQVGPKTAPASGCDRGPRGNAWRDSADDETYFCGSPAARGHADARKGSSRKNPAASVRRAPSQAPQKRNQGRLTSAASRSFNEVQHNERDQGRRMPPRSVRNRKIRMTASQEPRGNKRTWQARVQYLTRRAGGSCIGAPDMMPFTPMWQHQYTPVGGSLRYRLLSRLCPWSPCWLFWRDWRKASWTLLLPDW